MSSLERLLSVLEVFTEQKPIWTLDDIVGCLGLSRSQAYRYVRELANSALLMPIGRSRFVLGPKIIALDRQIRLCDPLLTASQPIMRDSIQRIGEGILTLSTLYRDRMMCIHQEPEAAPLKVSYSRGRMLPLFLGSTSRVILAHIPERRLIALFLKHRPEISAAGLGEEWDEFRDRLREIRRAGVCVTHAAIDAGVICAAVPLFNGPNNIIGAICLVRPDHGDALGPSTVTILEHAARQISAAVTALLAGDAWAPLPCAMVAPAPPARR
ncbi:MAG: IclR family transcriptional regulator, partial [Acetobacteraceae bacterium]